eukprot:6177043-Pleurochrysis_carterae.AAC.1
MILAGSRLPQGPQVPDPLRRCGDPRRPALTARRPRAPDGDATSCRRLPLLVGLPRLMGHASACACSHACACRRRKRGAGRGSHPCANAFNNGSECDGRVA